MDHQNVQLHWEEMDIIISALKMYRANLTYRYKNNPVARERALAQRKEIFTTVENTINRLVLARAEIATQN